jgi:hypothetical protein
MKLPWIAKWAIRQTLGTVKGNAVINEIENNPAIKQIIDLAIAAAEKK